MEHNFPYDFTLDDYDWERQSDDHEQDNGVLKNYYNFSNTKLLNAAERDFSQNAEYSILEDNVNPVYSGDYYQSIHQRLFSKIYPWAGEFRTVDFSKGDSIFVPVQHISKKLNQSLIRLYCDLKTNDSNDQHAFANAIGQFVADVNIVHPFREGNGRTQRVFSQKVAHKHGYHLSYESVSNERMKNAAIAAFGSDYRPMQSLMRNIIGPKPSERLAISQDEHLIDDDDFNYIKYKSKNADEDQKIESGVVQHVSENYILMKNDDGFSVYKRLDFGRDYEVGQVIGKDGELVGKVEADNKKPEIDSKSSPSIATENIIKNKNKNR